MEGGGEREREVLSRDPIVCGLQGGISRRVLSWPRSGLSAARVDPPAHAPPSTHGLHTGRERRVKEGKGGEGNEEWRYVERKSLKFRTCQGDAAACNDPRPLFFNGPPAATSSPSPLLLLPVVFPHTRARRWNCCGLRPAVEP